MVLDPLKVKKEMLHKDQFGFQPVDIFSLQIVDFDKI